jgi:hypothetical protein
MFKKPFKKKQQGITGLGSQTVFSNTYDAPFNPNKLVKYYGIIEVGSTSYVTEYEGRFRSEAKAVLEENARLAGGKLTVIGVYK